MAALNLRHIKYWENQERRVLKVLILALRMLSRDVSSKGSEDPINRQLYFKILKAIRVLNSQGAMLIPYPMYEAQNQPDAGNIDRARRVSKRPDLQFGYIDHHEPNPLASAK